MGATTDAQTPLSTYDLAIIGRFAYHEDGTYYVPQQRWEFMRELAAPFRRAACVCYVLDRPATGNHVEVDDDVCEIHPNEVWKSEASWPAKLHSVRQDTASLGGDQLVTYTYYPGTYSFLIAPAVLRRGQVNVAYFGKAARATTDGLANGRLLTRIQRAFYPRAERYVVDRSDAVFVRDPRVGRVNRANVELSKPLTDTVSTVDGPLSASSIDEPVELLYVASFRPPKGHAMLVDALASLSESSSWHYRLRLVGDGKTRERIERQVRERGLADIVEFSGHVADDTELRRAYESADVFVLPSETEGFPRVLNEAMAMGLPVVSTRAGGIPELLDDRSHALLVDVGDTAALASAIEEVATDRNLRKRIVEQAGKFASDQSGDPVKQHLDAIRRNLS